MAAERTREWDPAETTKHHEKREPPSPNRPPPNPDDPRPEQPSPIPDPAAPDWQRPVEVPAEGEEDAWSLDDIEKFGFEAWGGALGERRRQAQSWAMVCTWARQAVYATS